MAEMNLTQDQKRLLILISSFTKPAAKRDEEEVWIKKIPLLALVNRGIQLGIFKEYDFAPTLVDYMGSVRYANVSKEGEDDVADLREEGILRKKRPAVEPSFVVVRAKGPAVDHGFVCRMEQPVLPVRGIGRNDAIADDEMRRHEKDDLARDE